MVSWYEFPFSNDQFKSTWQFWITTYGSKKKYISLVTVLIYHKSEHNTLYTCEILLENLLKISPSRRLSKIFKIFSYISFSRKPLFLWKFNMIIDIPNWKKVANHSKGGVATTLDESMVWKF